MKKLIYLSIAPVAAVLPIAVSAGCNNNKNDEKNNNEIKNVSAELNDLAYGTFASHLKAQLQANKDKAEELVKTLNSYSNKEVLAYDAESKYEVDFDKSVFNDNTGNSKAFTTEVVVKVTSKDNKVETYNITFKNFGSNNQDRKEEDLDAAKRDRVILFNGAFDLKANNEGSEKTKDVVASELVTFLKGSETFADKMKRLKDLGIVNNFKPEDGYTYAFVDDTHAHDDEGELHFAIERKNSNDPKDVLKVNNTIWGFKEK